MQAEINPAFLGHLERVLKSPTVKTLEKIVHALDISLAELFDDTQPVDSARDAALAQVLTSCTISRSQTSSASMSSCGMYSQWGSKQEKEKTQLWLRFFMRFSTRCSIY